MTQLVAPGDWTGERAVHAGPISRTFFTRELHAPLLNASPCFGSSPTNSKGSNASARRGLRFEAKVLKEFQALYGSRFISQFPFFFQEEMTAQLRRGQRGKIITDGLLFSSDWQKVCVVEVKLRHTADAYFQTTKFYKPIIEKAFGSCFEVFTLEVVQQYDPRVRLPAQRAVVLSPEEVWDLRPCFHPVLLRDKDGR